MWIATEHTRLQIDRGQSTRLVGTRHAWLRSAEGTLWITLDDDPRDIVLEAGEGFAIERGDQLLVCALGGPALLELNP